MDSKIYWYYSVCEEQFVITHNGLKNLPLIIYSSCTIVCGTKDYALIYFTEIPRKFIHTISFFLSFDKLKIILNKE